jgi:hypothetical protein
MRTPLVSQSNYGSNPYHNSMHGADVCLFTHLFLHKYGFVKRLKKVELLATLLGAIVHDFNHPGTSNTHEVKGQSPLAVTYSDQSVLEYHHMWASFTVLQTKGFDILSGLSLEDYRTCRSVMIQVPINMSMYRATV